MVKLITELAKSGRSKCKKCKDPIDAKTVRVGKVSEAEGFTGTSWFHPTCITVRGGLPPAEEIDGFDELDAEAQETLKVTLGKGAPKRKASGEAGHAAGSAVSASPKPKKAKKGEPVELPPYVDSLEAEEAFKTYNAMKGDDLKQVLRDNKQQVGGKKDELVQRCVDGEMYGGLPTCPRCKKGRLRVEYATVTGHGGQGEWSCPGYFDSEVMARVQCGFCASNVKRTPWRKLGDPEPDEGAAKAEAAAGSWTTSFDSLAPDDKKGAAHALLARAKELKLSLNFGNERQSLMDCLSRLLNTRESTEGPWNPVGAIVALQDDFPPLAHPEDEEDDGGPSGANDDIAKLFEQMAKYLGILKPENFVFKVAALNKAARSIRARYADVRITSGKALAKEKGNDIGKGSAEIIDEFLQNDGVVAKLEEMKAEVDGA